MNPNPKKMFFSVKLAFISLMLVAAVPAVGNAATFTVNSTLDATSAAIIANCQAGGAAQCTLRAAIQAANASVAVADTIVLPAGTYTLSLTAVDNTAAAGDLDISGLGGALTINGAGAATTIIDGGVGNVDGVLTTILAGGVSANAITIISDVTIRNGNNISGLGGGISVGNGTTLTLNRVVVTACKSGGAGAGASGVDNSGTLNMNTVAVTNNDGPGGGVNNGAAGVLTWNIGEVSGNTTGGGIQSKGSITLTNVTVSGNSAPQAAGIDNSGTATLQNVTLSSNTAPGLVTIGGIRNVGGTVSVRNTIISGNTAINCSGLVAASSLGNNLEGTNSCAFASAGDLINTDPLIGALALNGGALINTRALPAGSPAIDKGSATVFPATDARGFARPVDGNIPLDGVATSDMGAYEFRPQKLTVTLPPPFDFGTVTSATTSDHTVTLANAGDGALIIGTIAGVDPLVAPFSIPAAVDTCSGKTLPLAGSCTFIARFAPTAAVTSPDTFNIPSNDPAAATVTFALTGTGTALPVPIILVTDSVVPANDLSVSFGNILVGATKDETITISNNGTANLAIGTIASVNPLAAPFSITVDGCSGKTIAPTTNCTVTVHFAPTLNSALSDTFDIPTNEADKPTVTMTLSGAGISVTGTTTTVAGNNPPSIPVLVSPTNGQIGLTTSVMLSWNKSVDPDGDTVTYQVQNCTDQTFSSPGCTAVDVPASAASPLQKVGLGGLGAGVILIGFVAGNGSKRSRKLLFAIPVFLLMGVLFTACGGGGNSTPAPGTAAGQVNFTVSGLSTGATYYWKVIAADGKGGLAFSETRSYTTQ